MGLKPIRSVDGKGCEPMQICGSSHRRKKFFFVFFLGGGGGGTGGARWAKPFAGCELIAAPATKLCQITTFLTLEIDNIAKLRIEFKSILLEIPSVCCIVVLRPRCTSKVMSGRSVNLTTLFIGRLRPPKRLTSTSCTYFRQKLTTASLKKRRGETKVCCQTEYRTQDP